MGCQDLVCARCAVPISQGRCPNCVATRARMQQRSAAMVPLAVLLVLAVALVLLTLTH